MNYEIKRVVANEDETFVHMGHNFPKKVDLIENVPSFCRADLRRHVSDNQDDYKLGLPLTVQVTNLDEKPSDLEVYFSTNTKEPCQHHNDKKITTKDFGPNKTLKFVFNEDENAAAVSKFPGLVFFSLVSNFGCQVQLTVSLTQIRKKRIKGHKEVTLAKARSKINAAAAPLSQEQIQTIWSDLTAFYVDNVKRDAASDFVARNKRVWQRSPRTIPRLSSQLLLLQEKGPERPKSCVRINGIRTRPLPVELVRPARPERDSYETYGILPSNSEFDKLLRRSKQTQSFKCLLETPEHGIQNYSDFLQVHDTLDARLVAKKDVIEANRSRIESSLKEQRA